MHKRSTGTRPRRMSRDYVDRRGTDQDMELLYKKSAEIIFNEFADNNKIITISRVKLPLKSAYLFLL